MGVILPALQPFLIGKAVVSLKSWLMSPGLHSDCSLPVHSSTLAEAVHSSSTSDPCIGQLKVRVVILSGHGSRARNNSWS